MKNNLKYESYAFAFKLLEHAKTFKDFPNCIAAIAVTESLIADRCQSFLYFKEKEFMISQEKQGKLVSTKVMLDKCEKYFPNFEATIKRRVGNQFKTINLFFESKKWLKARNKVLHSFVKSKPLSSTMNLIDFYHLAIQTAEEGLKLATLIKKWHQQQLRLFNKM
jgi:hypothetical protein